MSKRFARLTYLAILVAALHPKAVWGESRHSKLDQSLQQKLDHGCRGSVAVIVTTEAGYRKRLHEALAAHGNRVTDEFPSIDGIATTVSCADLKTLTGFPSVRSISADAHVTAHASSLRDVEGAAAQTLQAPLFQTLIGTQTGLSIILKTDLRTTRPSTGVAVIDSGIEPGVDFKSITAFYDFTSHTVKAATPSDQYGHGTHVAGLIASKYVGIAPDTRLVGLKVLDANGQGSTSDVVRAIEFAVANRTVLQIQVINLSLGHPIFERAATDPLVQAVESATRAGLTVVVSAGNFGIKPTTGLPGYAGIASPGNAPSALSVGAVRTFNTVSRLDDRVAAYSSRGPSWYDGFAKPDFVAPGDNLLSVAAAGSTLRKMMEARGNTGNYMRLSGTSMAAGVVSGMVALVLQNNYLLTPNTVKAVLQYTAFKITDETGRSYDALTQGGGSINGVGALALARNIDTTKAVGQKWLTASVTQSSVVGGISLVWSQSLLWGNHLAHSAALLSEQRPAWALSVVWGEALEDDDNIVWGNSFGDDDNVVWGNTFDSDDNIVWGNNVVWGNSFDDGDNVVWGNTFEDDNVVWGNNIAWGDGLIGMSLDDGDNVVWGNALDDDNVVWGNFDDDNVVWGNLFDDNVVWGNNLDDDNVVWGNSVLLSGVRAVSGGLAVN